MGDACDLSQYTISKRGTTCIFGTCQSSQNWSSLATDFLVVNLLSNPRYHKVVCLNFENANLITRYETLLGISGKRNSKVQSKPLQDNQQKLVEVRTTYSDKERRYTIGMSSQATTEGGIWDTVLAKVSQCLTGTQSTIGGSVAVVINSLSELILTVGFAETRQFLRRLTALLHERSVPNSPLPEGTTADPSLPPQSPPTTVVATAQAPCILLPVHQTLHSPAVLAQIQTLGSVLVRVVPNRGTLADTVACEIQTVRRSSSGKISESTEMFGCAEGLLYPLKPVTAAVPTASPSDTAAVTEGEAGPVQPSLPSRDAVTTTRPSAASTSAPAAAAATAPTGMAANTRLVTFDSTDPEFDEDSDPDADLDL